MTGTDLLAEAVTELYSAGPEEFIGRRRDLVAQARAAGEAAAAKQIAALRKPTQSAWVVNQLARSAPGAVSELSGLGQQLRDAQRSGDGQVIRELSQRRHQLVEDLVRQALKLSGQRSPPAALRDEVTAILSAAVADPQVAERLTSGTLERAVRREGFGPAGVLTLVTPEPGRTSEREAGRPGSRTPGQSRSARRSGDLAGREDGGAGLENDGAARRGSKATGRARRQEGRAGRRIAGRGGAEVATVSREERERRRQDAIAEAERQRYQDALADAERGSAEADRAADAATAGEREQEEAVRLLEEQLAEARMRLSRTRAEARRLRSAQRRARQALQRLQR